ncbi:conserved hypothetical protein [Methanothermus fervidus DSM 2088]|uniref:VapC9 PIN-like domain-containing protein n=1 Tax=Methanothermus fervidus (strain ATCC 43054 / DSM 2088 / JCM 10308 / V24 S) TaxID=523846 RepID=E3GY62_METFV
MKRVRENLQGKDKIAADFALKLIKNSKEIEISKEDIKKGETIDDALLRVADILCTNDKKLRKRAREKGIPVIYLRQKKYLDIDGYIR